MAAKDPKKIEMGTRVARSNDILEAELDGEWVMMSVDKGEYYGLDAIGSEIWTMLAEPRSVASLCAALRERFEVEVEVCERDTLAFLETLLADGSLRIVD